MKQKDAEQEGDSPKNVNFTTKKGTMHHKMNNLQILYKSGLHFRDRNAGGMLNFLFLIEFSFSFDSLLDVSLTCESLEFNLAEEPPPHPQPRQPRRVTSAVSAFGTSQPHLSCLYNSSFHKEASILRTSPPSKKLFQTCFW